MRDQLVALAKLATIDSAAYDVDVELKEIPERISGMRTDLRRLEDLLGREREQLVDAERVRNAQQEEITAQNDALAKARAKSAKARNARESEAAEREVETARRTIREREEEIVRLDEMLTKVRASVAEHEQELSSLRTMFEAEEAKANGRLAELESKRAEVVAGREDLLAKLPANIVRRYEQVRQKKGSGVVLIDDGTCKACRMALPAQMYIEVQRGDQLHQCPTCVRLVIYKPLVDD